MRKVLKSSAKYFLKLLRIFYWTPNNQRACLRAVNTSHRLHFLHFLVLRGHLLQRFDLKSFKKTQFKIKSKTLAADFLPFQFFLNKKSLVVGVYFSINGALLHNISFHAIMLLNFTQSLVVSLNFGLESEKFKLLNQKICETEFFTFPFGLVPVPVF